MLTELQELKTKILNTIEESGLMVLLGLPMIGKTRLIKNLVYKTEFQNKLKIISLEFLKSEIDAITLIDKVIENLSLSYENGIRFFIISYTPLDIDSNLLHDVIKRIMIFRQTCIETPGLVFLLNSDPLFYEDVFKDIVGMNTNKHYLKSTGESANEIIDLNMRKLEYKQITKEDKKRIMQITGGIAGFIKPICFWIARNKRIDSIDEYLILLKNDIEKFYSELPNYDLELLKRVKLEKIISEIEKNYLLQIGAINVDNTIKSELIDKTILGYTRNYDLIINNGRCFVNGSLVTHKFTPQEKDFLLTIFKEIYLSREDVGKLIAGKMYKDLSEESLDQFFSRLRKKLKDLGVREDLILTRKRYGYKINN